MRNRIEEIHSKGFNIIAGQTDANLDRPTGYIGMPPIDFNKIKVGAKTLDDAILNLGTYNKVNPRLANKIDVLRAIDNYDLKTIR